MQTSFRIGQLVQVTDMKPGKGDGHIYCIISVVTSDPVRSLRYRVKNMNGIEREVGAHDIKAAPVNAVPR